MELLIFLIGVALGATINCIVRELTTASGTMRIDHSNPEKDLYRLEIDNLDKLSKKTRITLDIDHNADLSQK